MRTRSYWLFATLLLSSAALDIGCGNGNEDTTSGAGGTNGSQAGSGPTASGGKSTAQGGANTSGRSGGNAGSLARGGSAQAQGGFASGQAGFAQAQGGANQGIGGDTQAQGGAGSALGGAGAAQGGAGSTLGGAGAAQGGADVGGRSGGNAGSLARGGSAQAGSASAQAGSASAQAGSASAQAGAAQGLGGSASGGASTGMAGVSGTTAEPCVGELSSGVCVPLAPFALVQSVKRTAGTAAPTDVIKLGADSQVGNHLVLGVGVIWNATAQAITVPSGFALIERRDNSTATAHETAALYIIENAQSLAAGTGVTVTVADSQARQYLVLAEYEGLLPNGALDQKASQAGTSSLSTGATATTTMDNELWLAITVSRGGVAHQNPTGGFTFVQQMTTGAGAFSLTTRQATERGAATSSLTGSGDYAALIATFRRRPLQ